MKGIADRRRELKIISDEMKKNEFVVLVLQGPEGVGKTTLLNEFLKENSGMRCNCPEKGEDWSTLKCLLHSVGREDILSYSYGEVMAVYGVHRETGILLSEVSNSSSLDGDMFAGMLTAVQAFVADSLSMLSGVEEGYLSSMTYGEFRIVIARGRFIDLVAIVRGVEEYALKAEMLRTLGDFEESYESLLSAWDGNVSKIPLGEVLEKFVGQRKGEEVFISATIDGFLSLMNDYVIVIDDAQNMDDKSLRFLRILMGRAREENRGKFLLSVNVDYPISESLASLISEFGTARVDVGNMHSDAIVEFVSYHYGDNTFPQSLYETLESCTGGNPLKMLNLLRHNEKKGEIVKEDGFWIAKNFQCVKEPKILPPLSGEERDLLLLCAAVGFVTAELASEILDMKGYYAMRILRKMEHANILERRSGVYMFSHDSLRNEILSNGDAEEIRDLQRFSAEFYLEKGDEKRAALIMEMYAPEKASEIYLHLAEECERTGNYGDEVEYLLKAGKIWRNEDVLLKAGKLLMKMKDYSRASEIFKDIYSPDGLRGFVLARAHLGEKVDVDDELLSKRVEAIISYRQGDFRRALNLAIELMQKDKDFDILILAAASATFLQENSDMYFEEAERIAKDGFERFTILKWKIMRKVHGGDAKTALGDIETALRLASELGSWNEMATILNEKGNAMLSMGRKEDALSAFLQGLRYAEMQDDVNLKSIILGNIALLYMGMGEYQRALKYQRRVLRLFELANNIHGIAFTHLDIGLSEMGMGNWKEAEDDLRFAVEHLSKVGDIITELYARYILLAVQFVSGENCKLAEELKRTYERFRDYDDIYSLLEMASIQVFVDCICGTESGAWMDMKNNEDKLPFEIEDIEKAVNEHILADEMRINALYRKLSEFCIRKT